ncbi:MAG: 5-methyltetrahydropteroyltriglutamate--homocysteine methyltransferase [Planctomycetes bacterium]|nr:5-methyltetrahydropteroyltriglutamate--homocysteine methyltransferase [Planctomycetota bacterium]
MTPNDRHALPADVSFDGGDLDCGNGLLLLIRKHIDPMARGGLLEILSTEISVEEDLPAWCRLTGNELLSWTRAGSQRSFLVCKGPFAERPRSSPETSSASAARPAAGISPVPAAGVASVSTAASAAAAAPDPAPRAKRAGRELLPVHIPDPLPEPASAPAVPAFAVMGIGSWPRPRWMLQAIHEHVEGRLSEEAFQETADDAVRLAVEAQLRAGVDVVTDGEERRDSYASFVGGRLDNCQLIPITDLLPLVDDPETFERELRALDVPAGDVRHPAVFGPLGRTRALAVHELAFARTLTGLPVKLALPGPYLLSRTMWMECISDRAYASRERLAEDVVRVLREELFFLLAAGAAIVQFDEPVLSEVVFSGPKTRRSFMCGALSERSEPARELAFARELINAVVRGAPRERTAIHICRGNWTRDESAALAGDYRPLMPLLRELRVGTYFLELCTPRAGEMEVLTDLPEESRIGVGVVNQKHAAIEPDDEILARGRKAVRLFAADRVLLNPDCGFATFADNPLATARIAEEKLRAIARAARVLRTGG